MDKDTNKKEINQPEEFKKFIVSTTFIFLESHFLEGNFFNHFVEIKELYDFPEMEREVLIKYFTDFQKYLNGKRKYESSYHTVEGIIALFNNEDDKKELDDIYRIIIDDILSDHTFNTSGKEILTKYILSKNVMEILTKTFKKNHEKMRNHFEIKFLAFEKLYELKRLRRLHKSTIIEKELAILYDDFNKNGGFEIMEMLNIPFSELLNDIEGFNDKMLTISGVFERDYNFFLVKKGQDLDLEVATTFEIVENWESKIAITQSQWENFVSKSLLRLFYVNELSNYIDRIKNFEGDSEFEPAIDFTLNRQVMALDFLLRELEVKNIDNSVKARFMQFITRRNLEDKLINRTELYKKLISPCISIEDREFLKKQFENIGLSRISEKIENF